NWTALAGNSSGTATLQENASGLPAWVVVAVATGTLVSFNLYSATVTVTILGPEAWIRLRGATGGSGGTISGSGVTGGTGGPGYVESYLTGLTVNSTLVFTSGAAGNAGTGGASPTAGGNAGTTTLASGTQSISTLTAGGSNGSHASPTDSAGTSGGSASGGN